MDKSKTIKLTIIVSVLLISAYLAWMSTYGKRIENKPVEIVSNKTIVNTTPEEKSAAVPVEEVESIAPINKDSGASLDEIKFTLPNGWTSSTSDDSIFLTSATDGGYIIIKAYDYPVDTGRRANFCRINEYCISETYFEETQIGNINGYTALGLDNSGGGAEYFGAKGGKFYVISTYSPPNVDEHGEYKLNNFNQYFDEVMESLRF